MSASIISSLSISGSRKADGTANDSGKVWAYLPDTTTPATLYADPDATIVLTQPLVLDVGGRVSPSDAPDGVFAAIPIRLYIEDSSTPANVVSDSLFTPATATNTTIDNDGWTGPTEDDAWTALAESLGGVDGRYQESGGATSRTIKAKFAEIWISVKDFGAVGDGVATDTTAIQAAMNRVKSLGGGVCYFPPGTYKIDQALTLSSTTGVRLVGSGSRASIIATASATANTFTLSSCTACSLELLRIDPAGANSGAAVGITSSDDTLLSRLTIKSNHAYGIDLTSSNLFAVTCTLVGTTRDVRFQGNGAALSVLRDTQFGASAAAVEMASHTANVEVANCYFLSTIGILFTSGLDGTGFTISGSPTLASCTTPLSVATATLPNYRQWGNGIEAVAYSGAIGTAVTPELFRGNEIIVTATGVGAGTLTVNDPAILPGTATTDVNLYYDFVFISAATGNVTFSFGGTKFRLATAFPVTTGHTICIRFRWDRSAGLLREVSRADSST